MTYDLLIVGSGSAGVAAALEASALGAKAALVEAGVLGGTCVNVGCVPSKYLLRAADAFHRAGHPAFPGLRTEALEVDWTALLSGKEALISALRKEKYQEVLEAAGVLVLRGRARFLDGERMEVEGREVLAGRYLLATGARPFLPPIPGLRESAPWTYLEALSAPALPESLLVVGGGPVGLELAQAFARLGSRVVVLEALPEVLPQEDRELARLLRGYMEEEGLRVHTGVRVEAVAREGSFRVQTDRGVFEAERLLVATGRRPDLEGLGLERAGVARDERGFLKLDPTLRTTNPRVYAAGDAAGLPQFVYVAAHSGRVAARNALGVETPLDLAALPRVTFTDPALAAVGLTEEEARARGLTARAAFLPLSLLPKALTARDTRGGFKIVVDEEGTVLGLHVLAHEAGDVVQEGILAVKYGLSYRDLVDAFHPYLTLAEGVRLVAQALDTDPQKLSCCA
ncbi:mercury(II) reductase [Thermus sp.]|uniref:mercury(II) reductase n=1 Tax=Thermus sp. TaxID=275 RepID=UPI0032205B28